MFFVFDVWSFFAFAHFGCSFVLLFGRGRVCFFAVRAGAGAPPKQQKKNAARPNSQTNQHASGCTPFSRDHSGDLGFRD